MNGEQVLLAVAVACPLAGTLLGLLAPSTVVGRRILKSGALVSAVAWGALLVLSSAVHVGGFHSGPLVSSTACGAALLLISVDRDAPTRPALAASGFSLVFIQAALATGGGGGNGGALVGGLAASASCALAAAWEPGRVGGVLAPPAAAIGVLATAVGVFLVHDETSAWLLPAVGSATVPRNAVIALVIGAAGLCIAGGLRPGRSTVLLLAGGLGVGARAGPLLGIAANVAPAAPGTSEGLAGLVLALALVAIVASLLRKPPLAIAMLSLAVAAGPLRLLPASRLLAAAAVLALAIDRAPAWLLVVPGAAALVVGAVDAGSVLAIACAGAVATVGAVLAGVEFFDGAPATEARNRFDIWSVPTILAGGWLLLAPGRWTWTAAQELRFYDIGAARAAAAGLIAAVLVIAWWSRAPAGPETEPESDPQGEVEAGPEVEPGAGALPAELVLSERSAP
ncbi:MAG TPA: hypothetical protein VM121_03590 [Acidimicrobiales bacterium]|nr:hypothetical protein [Acidimicrobiales bacterium]